MDGGGEWRTAVCRRGNNRYLEKLSKTCVVTVVRGGRGYLADIYVIVMAPRIIGFISLHYSLQSLRTHTDILDFILRIFSKVDNYKVLTKLQTRNDQHG